MTPSPSAAIAYADPDLRALVQRMRSFLRGRNAGELIGFDAEGRVISCRLTGYTSRGMPVSTPRPREAEAAYLFYGATSQDRVAEAVATKELWLRLTRAQAS